MKISHKLLTIVPRYPRNLCNSSWPSLHRWGTCFWWHPGMGNTRDSCSKLLPMVLLKVAPPFPSPNALERSRWRKRHPFLSFGFFLRGDWPKFQPSWCQSLDWLRIPSPGRSQEILCQITRYWFIDFVHIKVQMSNLVCHSAYSFRVEGDSSGFFLTSVAKKTKTQAKKLNLGEALSSF